VCVVKTWRLQHRDAVPGGYGGVIRTSKQDVAVNNRFETTNLVQVSLTSL
jgi:hypothetical protein